MCPVCSKTKHKPRNKMSTISSISHVSSASHSLNQTAVAKAQAAAAKAQQKAQAIAAKAQEKALLQEQKKAAKAMLKEKREADAAARKAAAAAEREAAKALKAAQPKRPVGRPRKAESVVSTSSKPMLVPIIPSPLSPLPLPSPSLTQLMAEVAELRTHLAAQTAAFNAVSHKLETIRSALLA